MTLEVAVQARLGEFSLDAAFAAGPGVTALFGQSGAGKTSVVNMIAGLVRPAAGRVVVDGRALFDAERRLDVPAHRRRVGYVFQEARLFPHLSVRRNLRFGRWFTPAAARRASFEDIVGLLGLEALLERRPGALSGGEKQRVAIGRALLASPRLLLMDEPLASLDEQRKAEILPYVERLRDELSIPMVYVSHSVPEVARLADTLVVLSGGRVAASGPPAEVMSRLDLHPLTGRWEAGALVEATVARHDEAYALTELAFPGGRLLVPRIDLAPGRKVRARIRARDVALALAPPQDASMLNVVPGTVAAVRREAGAFAEVQLAVGGASLVARITRRSLDELGLAPGKQAVALIKAVAIDRHSLGLG